VATDPLDRRAVAPGSMVLDGMTIREQRAALRALERVDPRWRGTPAPDQSQAEAAPAVPAAPPVADSPAPVQWAPLWELGTDTPPGPMPEQVREQKRRRRREALLLRLVAEHTESLRPALLTLLREELADLVSRRLAAEVPDLLAELEKE